MQASNGLITGFGPPAAVRIDQQLGLTVDGIDAFTLDANGFGGSRFLPAAKRTSIGAFDQFSNGNGAQLDIARSTGPGAVGFPPAYQLSFAAYGLFADPNLCFYAVGLPTGSLQTSNTLFYQGGVDGLAQSATGSRRLYDSPVSATIDFATRVATVRLQLSALAAEVINPNLPPPAKTPLATIDMTFTLNADGSFANVAAITAPGGYTGTATGRLFGELGVGLGLAFQLRNAAGDVIYGVAAADANLI